MSWYPLRRLIIPVLLLITAAVLMYRLPQINPLHRFMLEYLPHVSCLGALALAAFFDRSRLFTAALLVSAIYLVVRTELQVTLDAPRALVAYSMVSVVTPALLLLLILIPEPGLRSRRGMLVGALVPVALLAGWWVLNHAPGPAVQLANTYLPVKPASGYVLSVTASAGFAFVLTTGLVLLIRRDGEAEAGLLSVLLFIFVMLAFFDRPQISAVTLGGAGLALIVSMVRRTHEMAFRDELTGLLGRRAFNDRLKGLGSRYVIAMLDVDHFKKFNDTWGHETGDDVLKVVAKHIDRVGGGGTAFRYGGEEFSVLFPGKTVADCEPYLEEVRAQVEAYEVRVRDHKQRKVPEEEAVARRGRRRRPRTPRTVTVTISIGMAEPDEDHRHPREVLKAADQALYRAKKAGRNRIAL